MTAIARREMLAGLLSLAAGPCLAAQSGAASLAFSTRVAIPDASRLEAQPETVVHDERAGFALQGFDPVAYFVRGAPVPGRRDFELIRGGVAWRFASRSNLAAFESDPDAYSPLFGAHDAFAVTQSRIVETSPAQFLIHDGMLLFFRTEATRAAFVGSPDPLLAQARRNWPALERQLAR